MVMRSDLGTKVASKVYHAVLEVAFTIDNVNISKVQMVLKLGVSSVLSRRDASCH